MQLFPYGTATLDRVAFQKALDDIGAQESAGTDFSLQVLAEHFERGVQLLADNELSPVLPEEAFKTRQAAGRRHGGGGARKSRLSRPAGPEIGPVPSRRSGAQRGDA